MQKIANAPQCIMCGLPQTENPHPLAGTPQMLNVVGAKWGCLPCAEKRANGRREVIAQLRMWLEKKTENDGERVLITSVLEKLQELDEKRRQEYHTCGGKYGSTWDGMPNP